MAKDLLGCFFFIYKEELIAASGEFSRVVGAKKDHASIIAAEEKEEYAR